MLTTDGETLFHRADLPQVLEEKLVEVRQQLGCEDAELESAVRQAVDDGVRGKEEWFSFEDLDSIVGSLLLQFSHPDQFVVFRRVKQHRLGRDRLSFEVLFASTNWSEVCDFRRTLTLGERKTTIVEFFAHP